MTIDYKGACSCNRWHIAIELDKPLSEFNPRICDCDYYQTHPSRIISDPNMIIELVGTEVSIIQNGDQLANFYCCKHCHDLLAVGCHLNGQLRGAVNADLLYRSDQLGESIQIQPRLLSSAEKLVRWGMLWGVLNGVS